MSKTFIGFGFIGLICDWVCVIFVLMLDLIDFAIWVFCFYGPLFIKIKTFFNGALNFVGSVRVREMGFWHFAFSSAFLQIM